MNKNQQKVEPIVKEGSALVVHSVFPTIQGEGPFAGCRAIFVRLAGCNLQCPLCDTEYTAHRVPYEPQTLLALVAELTFPIPELVVITGGEPLRQPIGAFCRLLLDAGFKVQIETNGTLYRSDLPYDHPRFTIVCSPKTQLVQAKLLPHIAAFKYVARADDINPLDGLPNTALDHPNKGGLYRPNRYEFEREYEIYLQPVDEQDRLANAYNLDAVVRSCRKFGHRLCLQLHKLIGVE